jgi:hypothetical protein
MNALSCIIALSCILIGLIIFYEVLDRIFKRKEAKSIEINEKVLISSKQIINDLSEISKLYNKLELCKKDIERVAKNISDEILKYYNKIFTTEPLKKALSENLNSIDIMNPESEFYKNMTKIELTKRKTVLRHIESLKLFIFCLYTEKSNIDELKINFSETELEIMISKIAESSMEITRKKLLKKVKDELAKGIKVK